MNPENRSSDDGETALAPLELPDLRLALDRIARELESHGTLGLISITVLRRSKVAIGGWSDYETVRRQISLFLEQHLRSTDTVLEPVVSGNTYVVLLGAPRKSENMSPGDTRIVQNRMGGALRSHLSGQLHPSVVERFGVHVGAALLRHEPGIDCARVIHRSLDEAIADALGRSVALASDDENHIRTILARRQIDSVYQPLVDLNSRSVIGFEALTRVPQPFANPELLFRAARDCGLLWPLERACRKRALEGLPLMSEGKLLFLNVEPESLDDPALLDSGFLDHLERSGLDPSRVVLEITEHARTSDLDRPLEALERCRRRGFRLAVDDVGAGFAGLLAIAEVEPDYLKVDMELVRNVHLRPVKRELIKTIARFTENTGTTLVAEGVETTDELSSLTDLGVRCAQGFLFSKPGAPPATPDWDQLVGMLV